MFLPIWFPVFDCDNLDLEFGLSNNLANYQGYSNCAFKGSKNYHLINPSKQNTFNHYRNSNQSSLKIAEIFSKILPGLFSIE